MSLLLTFFIMLVSISELKKDGDMRALLDAIKENFGNMPQIVSGVPGTSLQVNSAYRFIHSAGMRNEQGVKKSSRNSPGSSGKHKTVRKINNGNNTAIGGPVLFDHWNIELDDTVKARLDVLYRVIEIQPNKVVLRGHTSPEPIPDDLTYKTAMEISFQRAKNVANYLIEKGINKERIVISAAGAAELRSLSRNPKDQMLNHRVDVFLIQTYIESP